LVGGEKHMCHTGGRGAPATGVGTPCQFRTLAGWAGEAPRPATQLQAKGSTGAARPGRGSHRMGIGRGEGHGGGGVRAPGCGPGAGRAGGAAGTLLPGPPWRRGLIGGGRSVSVRLKGFRGPIGGLPLGSALNPLGPDSFPQCFRRKDEDPANPSHRGHWVGRRAAFPRAGLQPVSGPVGLVASVFLSNKKLLSPFAVC